MPDLLSVALSSLIAVGGCSSPAPAAGRPPAATSAIVAFNVRLNASSSGSARIGLGDTLSLTRQDGPTVGLVPTSDGDRLALDVFDITVDAATGAESRRWLGRVQLLSQIWTDVPASPIPLSLQWTDTLTGPPTASSQPAGPCTRCCVTCEGLTLCGCRIILDCGWCCCPDTCNCDNIAGRPTAAASVRKRP